MSAWRDSYGDPYRFERAQTAVNRRLIWVTIGAFFVTAILARVSTRGAAASILFLHPLQAIEGFRLWQLLTYGFCHDFQSIFHLLINMLMLYWFGRRLNQHYGNRTYLTFYLGAIVFAGLIYCNWELALGSALSVHGMLGASGAVMGVAVAYARLWPHEEILFFFVLRMKVWVAVAIFVGIALFYGVVMPGSGEIGYLAHLGGALWGWLWVGFAPRVLAGYERRLGGKAPLTLADRVSAKAQKERVRVAKKEADVRETVDRLLEKISREGIGALTEREKKLLKDSSKKYQDLRRL